MAALLYGKPACARRSCESQGDEDNNERILLYHIHINITFQSSYLQRASIVSKTLFIIPTDAYYYKIIETLKQ
jgi:hypothetical protein